MSWTCPLCKKETSDYPSKSRVDKRKICYACKTKEDMKVLQEILSGVKK